MATPGITKYSQEQKSFIGRGNIQKLTELVSSPAVMRAHHYQPSKGIQSLVFAER